DVWFTDRFVDLIEEGIDIAIRIGMPKDDSQLFTRTVAWQQFATCASPAYLAQRGVPQTPADLVGHDTIALFSGERPT
ncbi:LysR family transcriptional regulator, partial [Pseudomonas sp. GW247-3R2A]